MRAPLKARGPALDTYKCAMYSGVGIAALASGFTPVTVPLDTVIHDQRGMREGNGIRLPITGIWRIHGHAEFQGPAGSGAGYRMVHISFDTPSNWALRSYIATSQLADYGLDVGRNEIQALAGQLVLLTVVQSSGVAIGVYGSATSNVLEVELVRPL